MSERSDQRGEAIPGGGPAAASPAAVPDLSRRFVRVSGRRGPFVEFEFALGDPDLRVDLVLPEAAFAAFCRTNAVVVLEGDRAADARDWSMRRAAMGAVPEER